MMNLDPHSVNCRNQYQPKYHIQMPDHHMRESLGRQIKKGYLLTAFK